MSPRFSLPRAKAVIHEEDGGRRHCAACGDFIDPIDWCPECQKSDAAGNGACAGHPALRKRADAAFRNAACRHWHRSSYASDCLPRGGPQ